MRRLYFILITVLITSLGAKTQTYLLDPPELYIGTSHGATASMLYFSPNVKQNILLGYNGGVTVRYVSEKGKALQAELNFSQRGWTEKGGLYTRRLNYMEIPLLMNLFWGKKVRFFGNLGPKASFLIHEQTLVDKVPEANRKDQHREIDKRFDYGVTLGLGLEFAMKRQCFQLEARANYSLSSLFEREIYYNFSNNMNLTLNLGWMIRVNK